ncbi:MULTISPECIES: AP2 domain-containing protein [unclassified Variovorax]|jgi:hypothetical protein|uniref:AP2 domain-containing protein n=1 Tax=unclassified Variovorax TaxID=663243 RepID=UPI0021BB00B0|nr:MULTISPECIES: AP2 domain-containing protein [unclassified Variovorax]
MPKGIPNSAAMYGIFTRPWGYEVSVMRNGTRHYRQFGRASYGGAEQALAHAQDWRDAIVRQHPPIARRARAEQPRANNSTGAPGVYSRVAPDGRVRAWLAKTYIAEDQILQTYFSVDGADRAAHAAALAERARQLAQMTGLAHVHPAEEAIRRETDAAPRARTARLSRAEIVRRNNSSGTSGVQFKSPRPDHPGYWMAITFIAGRGTVSKAFSVKTHGEQAAKRLAIAERETQLALKRQLDGAELAS